MKKTIGYSFSLFCVFVFTMWQPGPVFASSETVTETVTETFKEVLLKQSAARQQGEKLVIDGRPIYAPIFLNNIYALNDFSPLWNTHNRQALLKAFAGVHADGLKPEDYHFSEIDRYLQREQTRPLTANEQLNLDILLTEGLVRMLYNLAYGKVDPVALDPNINFSQKLANYDFSSLVLRYLQQGEVEAMVNLARPQHSRYRAMMQLLADYRRLAAAGGWGEIPEGESLHPGDVDERVHAIRKRLQRSGDYPVTDSTAANSKSFNPQALSQTSEYDEALKQAVDNFQRRHGLAVDGVIGKGTLAAMNVPVEQRIDQIKVNLERQRWYLHQMEGEFIVVNIAAFEAYWLKDDEVIWQQIVQVGKEYTETPVFRDEIQYLEFNPTWTIPPGIIRKSILPNLKKDPGYLKKRGFLLLSLDGKELDAETIDWANQKGFPYLVRQPAGPRNALGLVKFMFPNPHYVYLHDTNHRELFDRSKRTFSSGCVRVRDPFDLAERLLVENQGWDRAKIDQVVASGRTTRVNLAKRIPIIIGYGTVLALEDGVYFYEDIYQRDQKVLQALDADFELRARDHVKASG